MASCNFSILYREEIRRLTLIAKIPKPKDPADDNPFAPRRNTDENDGVRRDENGVPMPQTLVRIPVLQQPPTSK